MGQEFRDLYTYHPLPGEPVRGLVSFTLPDDVPDDKIAATLKSLKTGRAPGASGMSTKDLKCWLATREQDPIPWDITLQLVCHAFSTSMVPTRARSRTLVLIPKPEPGQMHGIGLPEPVWKLISAVINQRLMQNIKFHDDLHGFLPAQGTGMACLEAKLEAQLAFQSGPPLYHVHLY